ncbi:hypothetical protein H5410_059310 [Solanum commersonii]|uniref:Uncharacterized protein n=1 Tax=Solanum commersonii TaxID=4109 RepID=A0A9J5W2I3_SOLCO|nr:hypothetical protein H5410_059310 [Solanum commersonii]
MGKFYRVVVRPTTFYEAKCWPIKKSQVQKKKIVQMRILMWVCGHTKSRSGLHVGQDEGSETEMIWTREEEYRRLNEEDVKRGKIEPKKYWEEVIRRSASRSYQGHGI